MTMPFSSAASRAIGDGAAVVVGPVAGNIDDAPQAVIGVLVEQRHREIDRARDRGARRPSDRRLHDFVGDGVRRFRTVDQPPGNDDLLVARGRPLEIGHRDLAVRQALQRLQKFLRDDGLRVTFALDREFIHVHRVGDVDGEDQFDIDGRRPVSGPIAAPVPLWGPARRTPRRRRRPSRPRQAPPRSRHTSASLPSRRPTVMVTRKLAVEKQEHAPRFTFKSARRHNSNPASVPPK